jgi:DNA polymerase
LLKPLIILGMGRTAAKTLLGAPADVGIGKLRGRFAEYNGMPGILISPASQIPVLPTYHPSALLRNQDLKRPAWEDLKILRTKLNELDENYAVRKAWEN